MGKKKGKAAKKTKQIQRQRGEDEEIKNAPHSFVIHRGKVGRYVLNLVNNVRRVMSPFTAANLKVQKSNILKDFIAIAGPLNVSHLIMFTKSEVSVNMRICRLPRGPTLTFKVNSYTLISDLAHHIRRHDVNDAHFQHHALLVMNNFSKDVNHQKLAASMFQNMFPSININKVKLRTIKRVVLLNYDEETDTIQFRHYNLRVVPLGVSRSVKKLQKKTVPKLEKYEDISQFLMNPGALSESEAELDGEHNSVELPQNMPGVGNTQNDQSAIRLKEIGPRMTLTLTKIVDGVCEGDTLYSKFDTLTEEQKLEIKKRKEEKRKLKAQRKAEQDERVRQKKLAKEKEKEQSKAKNKLANGNKGDTQVKEIDEDEDYEDVKQDEDSNDEYDDAEYFEKEVGYKPEKGLFSHKRRIAVKKRDANDRKSTSPSQPPRKKFAGKRNDKPTSGGRKKSSNKTSFATKQFTGGAKLNMKNSKRTFNQRAKK